MSLQEIRLRLIVFVIKQDINVRFASAAGKLPVEQVRHILLETLDEVCNR